MRIHPTSAASLLVLLVLAVPAGARALDWDYERVPYGTDDPDRQYLNIYLADGDGPTPVCVFAHANGGTADQFGQRSADLITGAGYSLVSWESVLNIASESDLNTVWSDARVMADWLRANALEYGLDPERVVICGRSRGSGGSWLIAHSGHPSIRGIYMYNALPDGFWAGDWVPTDEVTVDSPPLFMTYGPTPGDGDGHRPENGMAIEARYESLGLGAIVTLVHSLTADELDPFHYFPEFVASLDEPMNPGGDDVGVGDAGVPDAGDMDAGSVDAGSADAGHADADGADAGDDDADTDPGADAGSAGRDAMDTGALADTSGGEAADDADASGGGCSAADASPMPYHATAALAVALVLGSGRRRRR